MPRIVRNFFVELDVDGRASSVSTGPRSGNGGIHAKFYMREKGCISSQCIQVEGIVTGSGELILRAFDSQGRELKLSARR
jgi:hypothetical protein